jgi:serine/threonine protein kinase/Tfp pilus assembly protein PilF
MPARPCCPSCGAELPPGAPRNLCPRCLLRAGLGSDALSVSRHGGPAATVALTATAGSVLDSIAATLGSVPRILLRDTDGGPEPPIVRCNGEPDAGPAFRYRIDGEIARGGMGSVLRGRDPDLGRDVAVKVLREDLRDNAEMVRRFLEEAQIGGQLQHPGIVPIYEMGTFGDHRPYFTMKLVKGQTLAEMLSARNGRTDGLPRFLAIFEAIAQTVAYAHARGVIHRDLKPSNVMVGSFGEVQVMDWGLAKVLPRGGVVDDNQAGKSDRGETVIATARSGTDDSELSRAGSVLGTPSYMAPEQAWGEIERVDERADVFALGSLLCEILTGQPAFVGRSGGEIQRKAALGDLSDALSRLDRSEAGAELVALAQNCLARELEDRPRNASRVADGTTAYLSGVQERLRAAEVGRAAESARAEEEAKRRVLADQLTSAAQDRAAEERKRRRVQAALGLTFTSLVVLVGAFAWWAQEQRRVRSAQAERAVERAMEDAVSSYGRARGADRDLALWGEARSAAIRARQQAIAADAPPEVRKRASALLTEIEQIGRNRRLVSELLDIHASMGDKLTSKGNQDFVGADHRYGQAFRDYGTELTQLTPEQGADLLRKLGGPVRVELAAALDNWAYVRWRLLTGIPGESFSITRLLDPDPLRNRVRDAVMHRDLATLRAIAEEFDPAVHPAQTVNLAAVYLGMLIPSAGTTFGELAESRIADSVRLLRKAQPFHAGDFQINHNLAWFLLRSKSAAEAIPYATAAVSLRPKSAAAWLDLAGAFEGLERDAESIAAYRRVVELAPNAWPFLAKVASILEKHGKSDEARAEYRKAAALAVRFPSRASGDNAPDVRDFIPAWERPGLIDEIVSGLRASLVLDPTNPEPRLMLCQLLAETNKTSEFLTELERLTSGANGAYEMGVSLGNSGKLVEAAAAYRAAIRLKPEFAEAHCNLGHVLLEQGDYAEALVMRRRGHELGTKQPGWNYPSARWVAEAGRMLGLAERLPAVLAGDDAPRDNPERLVFARMAYDKSRHLTASRLWAKALEIDPKLGDDRRAQHRYNAACSVALAAAGQDKDEPAPDEPLRARLRNQALDWLKAELVTWGKLLESGPPQARAAVAQTLRHWKVDPDLAAVRDADALAQLPEAERKEWQALWADVDALLAGRRPAGALPADPFQEEP